jgi:hypothetical protein
LGEYLEALSSRFEAGDLALARHVGRRRLQDERRRRLGARLDHAAHLEPADVRQLDVQHDEVDVAGEDEPERFPAGRRLDDLVAVEAEQARGHVTRLFVIVHVEDAWSLEGHGHLAAA